MSYGAPKSEIVCKSYDSGSWLFNLPPRGRKIYDGSSSRVMFSTFRVLSIMIIINRPFWPHFIFILIWMSVASTSLLKDSYHHSSCFILQSGLFLLFNRICVYCIFVLLAICMCICFYLCPLISFSHKFRSATFVL